MESRTLVCVRVSNFRNVEVADFELSSGLHLLVGENAQGKTNFLESIHLISTSRLLRGIRDVEAIREGAQLARVEGDVGAVGATTLAVTLERGQRKRTFLNGVSMARASDIMGRLVAVCISALDLPIVAGEPADRRLFLDLTLCQIYPGYFKALAGYKRALEQRNALLKAAQEGRAPTEAFEPWEVQLSEMGSTLRSYRRAFLDEISPHAAETQGDLGEGEALEITYAPKDAAASAEEAYVLYGASRSAEIARGSSLVGPHRDDISLLIDGKEARLFGSQGQQRSAVIALKLATHERMREILGEPPLLLLDDMLSDLDAGRRARLCSWVARRAGQAVLTCTEASAAGPDILDIATIFTVHAGTLGPP